MDRMEKKYKSGSEWYIVLYKNNGYLMVQNEESKRISFGNEEDFDSFYWFPVNNSCLSVKEAKKRLEFLIDLNSKTEYSESESFYLRKLGHNHITIYTDMLTALAAMEN